MRMSFKARVKCTSIYLVSCHRTLITILLNPFSMSSLSSIFLTFIRVPSHEAIPIVRAVVHTRHLRVRVPKAGTEWRLKELRACVSTRAWYGLLHAWETREQGDVYVPSLTALPCPPHPPIFLPHLHNHVSHALVRQ